MKQFRCSDVVPGCKAVFREPTEEAILNAVARHARIDHAIVHIPVELIAQVRSHISSVSATA